MTFNHRRSALQHDISDLLSTSPALLPDNLLRTTSVGLVSSWYEKSFEEMVEFSKVDPNPPSDVLEEFCSTLNRIRERHSDVVR